MTRVWGSIAVVSFSLVVLSAQNQEAHKPDSKATPAETAVQPASQLDSITEGTVTLRGQVVAYRAVAGTLTVGATDSQDETLGPDGKLLPESGEKAPDASKPDEDFDRVWRDAVLNRVWSRLETYQASNPKNRYASVLQLRRDFPKASIDDIAERLTDVTGTRMTPEAFRKNLQRARAKFIDLLIQELRETIHPTNNEDVEAEIFDLGLGYLYRRYTNPADH